MGFLLESLGRGLLGSLSSAFEAQLADTSNLPTCELIEAARNQPENIGAELRLGRRYFKEGRFANAQASFGRILENEPRTAVARLGLICSLDELGQTAPAVEQLRVAQKQNPTDPAILFALGLCHERQDDLNMASRYYGEALVHCPQLRNARERLAAVNLHDGQIGEAVKHYELLCQWEPGCVETRLILANLLLARDRQEEAIEQYERALTIEPDNWVSHNDLATAYEQAGLFFEAIEQLHLTLEEQPGFPDTHLRLGDLYVKLGQENEALDQYAQALEIQPDYLEAVVKMGTQHLRSGRHIEAARWFNRAVEINDRLLVAYVGLGVAQRQSGQIEESLASFDMAASIEPNSTLLFSEMARLQLKATVIERSERSSDFDGASSTTVDRDPSTIAHMIDQQVDRHRQALRDRPNHADMHYRLGVLLRNRGRNDEAVQAFREAVEINPAYVKALIKLGLALKESGETDEAVDVLCRIAELDPDSVDLHYHLGLMFAERNRFELAVEHYEQALKGNPQDVDFHANLALALQNMGLLDRAAATWQAVCELTAGSPHAPGPRASAER